MAVSKSQILYKSKSGIYHMLYPFYTICDYDDHIQFNIEKDLETMKNNSKLSHSRSRKNPNQKWIYHFQNQTLNIDIKTTNVQDFCIQNNLNVDSIRTYIRLQKPYKGFTISREHLK